MIQGKDLWSTLGGWRVIGVGLVLTYLAPFYVLHIQSIASDLVFNNDELQWIWPLQRYADPELFPKDYLYDYAIARTPEGYKLLYCVGSIIIDPQRLSKVLSYALLFVTVMFAGLSAARLAGPVAGWATVALMLVGNFWLSRLAGGLPRSFSSAFAAIA